MDSFLYLWKHLPRYVIRFLLNPAHSTNIAFYYQKHINFWMNPMTTLKFYVTAYEYYNVILYAHKGIVFKNEELIIHSINMDLVNKNILMVILILNRTNFNTRSTVHRSITPDRTSRGQIRLDTLLHRSSTLSLHSTHSVLYILRTFLRQRKIKNTINTSIVYFHF